MISRDVLQIEGAKELMNLVNTFDALPYEDVKRYLNNFGVLFNNAINSISYYRYIFCDGKKKVVMKCGGDLVPSSVNIACFEAMLEIAQGRKFYVSKTMLQGFDYVFMIEGDRTVYQVMKFGSDGPSKIALYNSSVDSTAGYVPVLVFTNSGTEDLFERNEQGEEHLLPKGIFYTAQVTFRNELTGRVRLVKEGEEN